MTTTNIVEERRRVLAWAKEFRLRYYAATGRGNDGSRLVQIDKHSWVFKDVKIDAHSGIYGSSSVSTKSCASDTPFLLAALNALREQIVEKAIELAELKGKNLIDGVREHLVRELQALDQEQKDTSK